MSVQVPGNSTELLSLSAPSSYEPDDQYEYILWEWNVLGIFQNKQSYDELVAQYPDLAPPRLIIPLWIGDVNDMPVCEPATESSQNAVLAQGGGLTTMSEGDNEIQFDSLSPPCAITNLTQPFFITNIGLDTNRYTTITWQSCPVFRYIVYSVDLLTTNTAWLTRAYVWGLPNATATSWTDTTTTNVVQRFYKVRRILGTAISAGGSHSLAVRSDGTLWAWGDGDDGKLGDETYGDPFPFYSSSLDTVVPNVRPFPVEVADPTSCFGQTINNAVALAGGGDSFSVVVDADGRVWTWGGSTSDQSPVPVLGDGGLRDSLLNQNGDLLVPSPITGISNVVGVAAGYGHTLALRADGTVWAWGNGSRGQLGVATLDAGCSCTNAPAQSIGLTKIVAVAAGQDHSVALDENGMVWTWGNGSEGELGNSGSTNVTIPVMLTSVSNVIAVAAGSSHTMALDAFGKVWTWGDNSEVELGRIGTTATPGQVPNLSNVVAIAGGNQFSLAVTSNGQVYAWGNNSDGALGTNGPSELDTPTIVAGISNAVLISASLVDHYGDGTYHSMAMTVDQGTNRYWGWGENDDGAVGNGTNGYNAEENALAQYTPVSVQFCTRCQRCIQLGTNGSFTAQCTGTLVLYFNDEQGNFSNNSGSYTVTVDGFGQTNVPAYANEIGEGLSAGVAIGTVTNGRAYTFSASGFCEHGSGNYTDANGNPTNGTVNCSSIDITNAICPMWQCFSLVGKIQ